MSVLIKGMKMPETCFECDFCGALAMLDTVHFCDCPVVHGAINITQAIEDDVRHPDCPLVEVPTPHGRLIDERVAGQYIGDHMTGIAGREGRSDWQRVHDGLADTPTVVEAEREEQ